AGPAHGDGGLLHLGVTLGECGPVSLRDPTLLGLEGLRSEHAHLFDWLRIHAALRRQRVAHPEDAADVRDHLIRPGAAARRGHAATRAHPDQLLATQVALAP